MTHGFIEYVDIIIQSEGIASCSYIIHDEGSRRSLGKEKTWYFSKSETEIALDNLFTEIETFNGCLATDVGSWESYIWMDDGEVIESQGDNFGDSYDHIVLILEDLLPSIFYPPMILEPEQQKDVPFFHPSDGWMIGSERIDDITAKRLCDEMGIPFEPVDRDSPNNRAVLTEIGIAGTQYIEDFEHMAVELHI